MEEKLFWISLVSGGYAFAFKRFLRSPRRLEENVRVVLLNGLFWAFVGLAAGFLISSYKELGTLSWPIGAACALAGGLLGVLWVLPTQTKPEGIQILWSVEGMALALDVYKRQCWCRRPRPSATSWPGAARPSPRGWSTSPSCSPSICWSFSSSSRLPTGRSTGSIR